MHVTQQLKRLLEVEASDGLFEPNSHFKRRFPMITFKSIILASTFCVTVGFISHSQADAQMFRRFAKSQAHGTQQSQLFSARQNRGLFNATPEQKQRRRTLLLAVASGMSGFAGATAGYDWGASANQNTATGSSAIRNNYLQSQRATFNRGYSTNIDHAPVMWSRW
jgi:hypothetical protein